MARARSYIDAKAGKVESAGSEGLDDVDGKKSIDGMSSLGDTADYARAVGEDVEETRLTVGLRAWF